MLVLSRRVDEELVFPGLDIRVKVLRCFGNRVQLGIDAPDSIEIVRGERVEFWDSKQPTLDVSTHEFRNLLNSLQLSWELYNRQLSRGEDAAARRTILRLVDRLREADNTPVRSSAPAHEPALIGDKSDGPRVLVVDDDANERQLLAGMLQMDGYRVETACDGLDALTFLRHGAVPDVVLLDMQMPRLCGKDTLTAIRGTGHSVLVFGVSGTSPADNDISVGGPGGIDEWFQKPLNPRQLVQRLRQRVESPIAVSA